MKIIGTTLIKIEDSDIPADGHFIFPAHITKVGESAFEGCTRLTAVTLNDQLQEIGLFAFAGCTELTSVTLNQQLKTIIAYAFKGCTKLKAVAFNKNLTNIAEGTFKGCTGLTDVTFNENLIAISSDAFKDCSGLTTLTFNENLTQIKESAFKGCSGLITLNFNEQLTEICGSTFEDCSNIRTVAFNKNLKKIGHSAFKDCAKLTAVTFNEQLTEIGVYAFKGCSELSAVTFNENLEKIKFGAFEDCSKLIAVTLNEKLTKIGRSAFEDCDRLTAVTFNEQLIEIDRLAFLGCNNIKDIAIATKSKEAHDRVKELLPNDLKEQCIPMPAYEQLLAIRTEALRTILLDPRTNPIRRCAHDISSFQSLPTYDDFWKMLNQAQPESNPFYNKAKWLMDVLPWPKPNDEQGLATYTTQCWEIVNTCLNNAKLGLFKDTEKQQKFEFLKSSIHRAVSKYYEFLDDKTKDNRGVSLGFFTRFRHGEAGRLRAATFKDQFDAATNHTDALTELSNLLNNPSTKYHNHSFATYLLDELYELTLRTQSY